MIVFALEQQKRTPETLKIDAFAYTHIYILAKNIAFHSGYAYSAIIDDCHNSIHSLQYERYKIATNPLLIALRILKTNNKFQDLNFRPNPLPEREFF